VGSGPHFVIAADFNGDGKEDLATANYHDNNVTVLLGNGSGGFSASGSSPFAAGTGPFSLVAGDFNGDSVPDLAVANVNSNNLTLLLGNGSGGFVPSATSPVAVGTGPAFVTVGDFNGDGVLDLAAANNGDSTVSVMLGIAITSPYVNIDAPAPNATLSGTTTISGWALEGLSAVGPNAITAVTIQVDSNTPVAATYGGSRTDVCGALPGRPGCPNVGWTYNLNTSLLAGGTHTLKVVATDSAANTGSSQVTITTLGVPPWVNIDAPGPGATLSGTATISGWALEGLNAAGLNAISSVTVQVDSGTPVAATYGGSRTDVCGSLPGRPGCPNVGWTYNLNTSLLVAGSHTLKVTATDSANNTGSAQITVTTLGVLPWVNIDTPSANAALTGTTTVSGWALEGLNAAGPNAITSVTVQVDSNTPAAASYGSNRSDVCGSLPGRPGCPNVGWSYSLNTSLLAAGSHTLKVTATDSANNTGSAQVSFTTAGVLPWVNIDVPSANGTLSGTSTVSGWALEGLSAVGPNAISSVTVQVDNNTAVAATYGISRTDVCGALTGRPGCPNVGWSYNLNTSLLAAGSHTLKVTATDSANNTGSSQVTFTTLGVLPWVDIDAPTAGATLSGTTTISGWTLEGLSAAGPNAISTVTVQVDSGTPVAATYGSNRSDVCASLTGRPGCPNVGWSYNLNTSLLAAGSHTLKVTATDTVGNTGSAQVTFLTLGVLPWVDIDAPTAGATLSGTTAISGWTLEGLNAAGPNAIASVAVLVDGTQVGTATYGSNRSDVCASLTGRPGCPNVGWTYNLNVNGLAAGSHTLKVVATDTAAVSGSSQVTFMVAAIVPWVDIDAPAAGATLSGTTAISGWALEGLNAAGPNAISTVAVLVDGTQVGTATYGSNRSDVCGALTGRPGCPNVGWSYNLNVTSLSAGSHTLKVVATDTASVSGSNQVTFLVAAITPWVDIDVPFAGATLSGTTTISGWALEGLNAAGPNAIASVAVLVDGTQVGTATYGSNRSDVCSALTGRPGCPNVGWTYNLNVSALTAGSHTLEILATDTVGLMGSNQVSFTK
jgi:N-acetylmuramoyl-L-alanine amidase